MLPSNSVSILAIPIEPIGCWDVPMGVLLSHSRHCASFSSSESLVSYTPLQASRVNQPCDHQLPHPIALIIPASSTINNIPYGPYGIDNLIVYDGFYPLDSGKHPLWNDHIIHVGISRL